jgi:uncharacterized membrane protein
MGRAYPEGAMETLLWERVLRPHCSLPPAGFRILMLMMGGVSALYGALFVSRGAWPITGFFGLDWLLLYVALRLSYRRGRLAEVLRLAGDSFTVERIGGEAGRWRFQAFWLRVRLIETAPDSNRLELGSHGRSLRIGGFLSPAERRHLAAELGAALEHYRRGPCQSPATPL